MIVGMDPFAQLRAKARQKRDAAIQAARAEYNRTVRDIKLVCRAVDVRITQRTRPVALRKLHRSDGKPFHKLSIVGAAERVLSEGKPLTMTELVVELKARGYPVGDSPRRITRALREAFRYHNTRFKRGPNGRWGLA
jgi:hypothetical protein